MPKMPPPNPPCDGYDERDSVRRTDCRPECGTHNNGHKADAEDEEDDASEAAEAVEVTLAGVEDAVRLRGKFRKSGVVLPSVRPFVSQRAIF